MFLEKSILNKLKISTILLLIFACGKPKQPLPILGEKQINEQGEEIPIDFCSRVLNETESGSSIFHQEALGLSYACFITVVIHS